MDRKFKNWYANTIYIFDDTVLDQKKTVTTKLHTKLKNENNVIIEILNVIFGFSTKTVNEADSIIKSIDLSFRVSNLNERIILYSGFIENILLNTKNESIVSKFIKSISLQVESPTLYQRDLILLSEEVLASKTVDDRSVKDFNNFTLKIVDEIQKKSFIAPNENISGFIDLYNENIQKINNLIENISSVNDNIDEKDKNNTILLTKFSNSFQKPYSNFLDIGILSILALDFYNASHYHSMEDNVPILISQILEQLFPEKIKSSFFKIKNLTPTNRLNFESFFLNFKSNWYSVCPITSLILNDLTNKNLGEILFWNTKDPKEIAQKIILQLINEFSIITILKK